MRVLFWGTRGSLPSSFRKEAIKSKLVKLIKAVQGMRLSTDKEIDMFLSDALSRGTLPFSTVGTYGTNTSCVEIDGVDEYIICDAGTGIRDLGNSIMKEAGKGDMKKKGIFHIFISHLHWDHIQGFPFFIPAYIRGNVINIYGMHDNLEQAFKLQQNSPFFPVPLGYLKGEIRFHTLKSGETYRIGGLNVKGMIQNHPGDSFGYRFEKDGKTIVYSTDSEHKDEAYGDRYPFLSFFEGADLLIFDAQYQLLDAISTKENWGHSNNIVAVELSVKSRVKHLCIFHNEPTMTDEELDAFLQDTRTYLKIYAESYPLKIDIAHDGMEIEV
ncbi:MAG: MBL fold metallo-hydrolase [Syntrophorhabdaceae bacterium]|nr:MBL fold metallo-hydrolase [Syntrophorhabdaceae bacterium]